MTNVRCVWVCLMVLTAADAVAQPREPFGRFVVDARGTLARFKEDAAVASSLNVATTNMPTGGLGFVAGLHWYPIRGRLVSLGIGGEVVGARDSRTAEQTDGTVERPTVTTRFSSISPQVSLNFGKRDGWSYISGGIGRGRLTSERADAPLADGADRTRALNYGGGARWFTGQHLAVSMDLRFYILSESPAAGARPAVPRARMMVISAGIAMR